MLIKKYKMKKIFNIVIVSFLAVSFSSCLKDDAVVSPDGVKNVVEFGNISAPSNLITQKIKMYSTAFDIVPLDTLIVPINYAGPNMASKDITVNVSNPSSLLDEINEQEYGDDTDAYMEPMNQDWYTLPATVVIPSGKNTANLLIPIKVNQMSLEGNYAIPLEITNASGENISGNFGKIAIKVSPKNKYDGVYKLTGYHNRVPYNYPYDTEMEMVTTGANTVAFYFVAAGSFGHPIGTATGMSWYGSGISPVLEFDLNTNKIVNAFNQGGATVISLYTTAQGADAKSNTYDPATKTISVSWMYSNNPLRAFFDELVYLRSR